MIPNCSDSRGRNVHTRHTTGAGGWAVMFVSLLLELDMSVSLEGPNLAMTPKLTMLPIPGVTSLTSVELG